MTCCRYVGELALDLSTCLKQSCALTPIVLLYVTESATAERALHELSSKRAATLTSLALSSHDKHEEKLMRKTLIKAAMDVSKLVKYATVGIINDFGR